MAYHWLADAVLLAHFAFVAFVLLGGLLALKVPAVAFAHLPAAVWGVYIEVSGRICPLTPLENALRARAGEQGYAEGFIEHYLLPLIYPGGLTRELQLALAALVLLVNVPIYAWLVRRRLAARRRTPPGPA